MRHPAITVTMCLFVAVALSVLAGCNSSASAEGKATRATSVNQNKAQPAKPAAPAVGMAAMKKASSAKKYLFALFKKDDNPQLIAMRGVLQSAMKDYSDEADLVEVDITNPGEKEIVEKFDLSRAPMPLLLAVAPNGAVTGGFPSKVEKQDLPDCFVSPGTQRCMLQLQKNKLVFLCVQNDKTKSNEDAMAGVRQFKDDERFSQATEIVMLDPADRAEASFLKDLQIDPATKSAVTIFLAPPGRAIAMYEGATSMDDLVNTLAQAVSSCGPGGCGPGGCGPAK